MPAPVADLFISADSHVLEPGDLWHSEAPASMRDRVLRVRTDPDSGRSFQLGEDVREQELSMAFAAGQRGEDLKAHLEGPQSWEDRPDYGYVPEARMEAIRIDGVAREVLYPTLGLGLYEVKDVDLKRACFSIYNDWLVDFVRRGQGHFLGIGMVSIEDPHEAAKEVVRVEGLGLRGGLIPAVPPVPYSDPSYDPLWAAAEELGLPLSLHVGTGAPLLKERGPGAAGRNFMHLWTDVQSACQQMIWGGVFERFPRLNVLFVEIGIGWIAPLLERMDDIWEQHRSWMRPSLPQPPSAYFRRNCGATFERDRVGIVAREHSGIEPLMWATDFPHAESSWPESMEVAAASLDGLSPDEARAIAWGNVQRIYAWDLDGR